MSEPTVSPALLNMDKLSMNAQQQNLYNDLTNVLKSQAAADAALTNVSQSQAAADAALTILQSSSHAAVTTNNPIGITGQDLSLKYSNTQFQLDASGNLQFKPVNWTAWTPSWTNLTVGTGGTNTGYWIQSPITKIVDFIIQVVLGSSGFSVGASILTLPVTSTGYAASTKIGECAYSTSAGIFQGEVISLGALRVYHADITTGYIQRISISGTVPVTWASGDSIIIQGSYRAL